MNWELFFAGVGAAAVLLGGNAYLMRLVIGSEVGKALLAISKEYVTKEEFDRHIDQCPARDKRG